MIQEKLRELYEVQLLDTHIANIKAKAQRLDKGSKEEAIRAKIVAEFEAAEAAYKSQHKDLTDTELELKSIEEKKLKYEKRLFEGTIFNPKELENVRKEVEMLGHQRATMDDTILAMWDTVEVAKKRMEEIRALIGRAEEKVAAKKAEYAAQFAALEAEYKQLATRRKQLAGEADQPLLQRYEKARDRFDGVGLSLVRETQCTACGTNLPVSTMDGLRAGTTLITCDSCARILVLE